MENREPLLAEHALARRLWERKPVVQLIYRDMFDLILAQTVQGSIVEIGGGAGRLKEYRPDITCTDFHASPFVDLIVDAQDMPFQSASVDNIVMLDVLHHVPVPALALAEAQRVLKPGGRLVMLEPAITPGSALFYRHFHPEPVDMSVDPLGDTQLSTSDAYDSNQAIPTLLATRYRTEMLRRFERLTIVKLRWMSFLAYPLSGGLRPWSLIPKAILPAVLAIENRIPNVVGRVLGFRLLFVIEKI